MSTIKDELYIACREGNKKQIKKLIQGGNRKWGMGLYGACKGGHIDIVRLLLMIDKDIDNIGMSFFIKDLAKRLTTKPKAGPMV